MRNFTESIVEDAAFEAYRHAVSFFRRSLWRNLGVKP